MSGSTPGHRMGFNESTDLVGAPVKTSHGNGIVRSIGTPNSSSSGSSGSNSSDISSSSSAPTNSKPLPPPLSPPILVVELEDTSAQHTKNGSSSNSNGSVRDVSSDAGEEALTTSPPPPPPPPQPAQTAQPKSQAPRRIVRVTADQLLRRPPVCAPGTCVETTLGTGVLVSFRPGDGMHVVRLWKPRGAGSALAYLNRASMLRRLPAAVGIRVVTPEGEGVVVGLMGGG
ncbi:unnamed protein product, partial [Laminaria digitata]